MEDKTGVTNEQVEEQVNVDTKVENPEKTKAEIDGLNKRNSELEKQLAEIKATLDAEKKAKMSKEELIKAEHEEIEKEKQTIAQERRNLTVSKALLNAGLDPKIYANRIVGSSAEEIEADVQAFKDILDGTIKNRTDEKIKEVLNVKTPVGGSNATPLTEAEIEKLPTYQERQKARRQAGLIK